MATILGTLNADTLSGTSSNDQIEALDGNDVVTGAGGSDEIFGGAGNDDLYGGGASDSIYGGIGQDTISGGSGADFLFGGDGHDFFKQDNDGSLNSIAGGSGNDMIDLRDGSSGWLINLAQGTGSSSGTSLVFSGIEYVTGSNFGDTIYGAETFNNLWGGNGDDTLFAGTGSQWVDGGRGDDTIYASKGVDDLWGGYDDDFIIYDNVRQIDKDDYVGGFLGFDTLVFKGQVDGDQFNAKNIGIQDFESLAFGDIGSGIDVSVVINEDDAFDNGTSLAEDLLVVGNNSTDSTEGIIINLKNETDVSISMWQFVSWGDQNDFVQIGGDSSDETITGSSSNDRLFGGGGVDILYGAGGSDSLVGGGGADSIFGGSGIDVVEGGGANDRIYGGSANDTIFGNTGRDSLYGGLGDDTIFGGEDDDKLRGNGGDDFLEDGNGKDKLWGQASADVFSLVADSTTDNIMDFEDGVDLIQLFGVIAFDELGVLDTSKAGKVKVEIIATGELLFVQDGVGVLTAADLTAGDFGL